MLSASARRRTRHPAPALPLSVAALVATMLVVCPGVAQVTSMSPARKMVVPLASAEEGKQLFVGKGCVVCHQVNGVGGKAAPALDATGDGSTVDPLDFAARMWRGAPTMIMLQEMELGYQIELTGEEIAHLAAFASDPQIQKDFSDKDIPEVIRDWMVDEIYQELDPDNMAK